MKQAQARARGGLLGGTAGARAQHWPLSSAGASQETGLAHAWGGRSQGLALGGVRSASGLSLVGQAPGVQAAALQQFARHWFSYVLPGQHTGEKTAGQMQPGSHAGSTGGGQGPAMQLLRSRPRQQAAWQRLGYSTPPQHTGANSVVHTQSGRHPGGGGGGGGVSGSGQGQAW